MAKQLRAALTAMILGVLLSGCQKNQTVQDDGRSELLSAETETETSQDTTTALQAETESSLPEETEESSLETNADGVAILTFDDMYSSASSSRGLQFSEAFLALEGKTVQISGYMAPPLKPVFNFFVLSKQPMAICPFCSSDADWPEDIVAIYVEEGEKSVANDTLLTITGTLELGSYTDEDTGFVSQARIYADSIVHNR